MIRLPLPSRKYRIIWDTVKKIPRGKVATYGEIASVSGLLRHARLVGYALHNVPPDVKIPWHRVINAQGKISLSNIDGMYDTQMELLKKEGIVFKKGTVNLNQYGWLRGKKKVNTR